MPFNQTDERKKGCVHVTTAFMYNMKAHWESCSCLVKSDVLTVASMKLTVFWWLQRRLVRYKFTEVSEMITAACVLA
jgi:hypothetical protein